MSCTTGYYSTGFQPHASYLENWECSPRFDEVFACLGNMSPHQDPASWPRIGDVGNFEVPYLLMLCKSRSLNIRRSTVSENCCRDNDLGKVNPNFQFPEWRTAGIRPCNPSIFESHSKRLVTTSAAQGKVKSG